MGKPRLRSAELKEAPANGRPAAAERRRSSHSFAFGTKAFSAGLANAHRGRRRPVAAPAPPKHQDCKLRGRLVRQLMMQQLELRGCAAKCLNIEVCFQAQK